MKKGFLKICSVKNMGRRGLNMTSDEKIIRTIPAGRLAIIALESCKQLGEHINQYLVNWRAGKENEHKTNIAFTGYQRSSYLIESECPRFGSGEGKGIIRESVRGTDLYLLVDVLNNSITYSSYGKQCSMGPDEHFQDLKRIIAAVTGKANRINVIMPFLYEGRQHKRSSRESLDCALALQELDRMGVENIITFDAHDPRVQNAIPLRGFESVQPTYQIIKSLLKSVKDLKIDKEHMMIISPDEGGMNRCIYYASVLGLDLGMFYKRRDYTCVVNGRNPILSHEFLGTSVEGKDVLIIDDMISSGESMIEVANELKRRKANRVFIGVTFGLFTNGLDEFDQCYNDGIIDKLFITNLTYSCPELLSKPYYVEVDMSKYIALLIDNLNHNSSISELLDPVNRIHNAINKYNSKRKN